MWKVKRVYIKVSLNIFNTLIIFSGIILTLLGLFYMTTHKYEHSFIKSNIDNISISLSGIGMALIILGLVSYVSVATKNSLMVGFFVIGLVAATSVLAWIGASTYNSYSENSLINQAKLEMNDTFRLYNEQHRDSDETKQIDFLQKEFKCCGLKSYEDWKSLDSEALMAVSKYELLINSEQIPFDLPDSCCQNVTINCGKNFRFRSTMYLDGCFEPFSNYLSNRVLTMCCISIGLALVNFLTLSFMIYVCAVLKADYRLIKQEKSSFLKKIFDEYKTENKEKINEDSDSEQEIYRDVERDTNKVSNKRDKKRSKNNGKKNQDKKIIIKHSKLIVKDTSRNKSRSRSHESI